jgi:uncharacterized iron-regulated membrane protein
MKLRTVLFWSHLTAGVTAGIVVLIMSLTGALLTYERQLIEWSDRGYRSTPASRDAERLTVEALLERAKEQRPDQSPTAITLRSRADAPVALSLGQTTVYQDVYTGDLLGEPSTDVRRLMTRLRAWHRWLGMDGDQRAIGKAISGWANLIFLFIVLSGMYLWIPRRWGWQKLRAVVLFRSGLRGKARDFNWHNVIGIWCAIPLAIIVASAAPISFPWANALVYRMVGESVPAAASLRAGALAEAGAGGNRRQEPRSGSYPDGLNGLWARAEQQASDWRTISLRLPTSADAPAVFAIDSGTGGQPQLRSTLTLDARTGSVVRWEPFESQSLGRRLRSWTRFTHTGEYYGIVGQTLAGLVSAGAVILVCTGLALVLRRFFGKSCASGARVSGRDAQIPQQSKSAAPSSAAARVWSES